MPLARHCPRFNPVSNGALSYAQQIGEFCLAPALVYHLASEKRSFMRPLARLWHCKTLRICGTVCAAIVKLNFS
jgi:hypothetical protein